MAGAIIIAEPTKQGNMRGDMAIETHDQISEDQSSIALRLGETPLACMEVLGRSPVEHGIEAFRRAGVGELALFADHSLSHSCPSINVEADHVSPIWLDNPWSGVVETLRKYKKNGFEWAFIARATAYVELDPLGMLHFHRSHEQPVTRAFDGLGSLDIWLVDTAFFDDAEHIEQTLCSAAGRYKVPGYVNRLADAMDFRQLVIDGLTARCRLRPSCPETRAGVWIEQSAQVHKRARIMGPAYIGRGAKIAEKCLITRLSNVESNCEVDYGTVVENSSILSDSYVGVGLDVSHSVVDGSVLVNLEREVRLEISDPGMIRKMKTSRKDSDRRPAASLLAMTGRPFAAM